MSANTQILINGLDYTKYCDLESVEVTNSIVASSDTMKLLIRLRGEMPCPTDGNEIIWLVNGVKEYAGVISQIDEIPIGIDYEYTITAQPYQRWLDRHLVINFYQQMPADQMIKQIVSKFTTGFTTNNVQPGFNIPPQYFNYVKVSDAIKRIAEQLEYGWYISYDKDIHFYTLESYTSPLPNNTLNCESDVTNYSDLKLTLDGTQKKTRIYLKGFKSRSATPMTLNYIGDGSTMQWSLGYLPSRNAGDITVTVGGQKLTVKRDMVDGSPSQDTTDTTIAFVNYGQHLLRLNYAPAQGVVIKVVMYYLNDTVIMREDPRGESLAKIADGNGDGRYEYAHTEAGLSEATIDAATARGDMLLYKYSTPALTGTFNSFTQGWRAGQNFFLFSSRRMGGIDNYKMFVQEVQKKIVKADSNGVQLQYQITIADTPYLAV